MKQVVVLFLLVIATTGYSQVKCYKGNVRMMSDLCYRIDANGQLFRQTDTFREIEYLFVSGTVVYFGRKGDQMNPLYTIKDNKIYKGNSTMSTDLLYTIYENGIYVGTSTMSSDCLYTIKEGVIYKGQSDSVFDILLSCDKKELTTTELMLLMVVILPY